MKFRDHSLSFLIVAVISLFTLFPTFKLALFGDDWLSFWRYRAMVDPQFGESRYNNLTYFLTPYGPEDMSVGLLQKIFGYENSTPYFIVSYLLRLLSAFSFAPLVYYLTKNKLAVFTAMLFFSITTIGFDATNWVFNMPSYLCLALFNSYLYFLFKSREKNSNKLLALAGVLFYLTYISQPIRMPALLPFTITFELFWVIYLRRKEILKQALIRITFFTLIFIFILISGRSAGVGGEWTENLSGGVATFKLNFENGRIDLLFYPFAILGGLILPDLITPNNFSVATKPQLFFSLMIPLFIIFSFLSYILLRNIQKGTKLIRRTLLAAVFFNIIIFLLRSFNLILLTPAHTILMTIGGYLTIWVTVLFLNYYKDRKITFAFFLAFGWTIASFILAWIRQPNVIIPTTHRYMIGSASGIAILLAILISLGERAKNRTVIFSISLILIIVNIFSTRMYIDILLDLHSQEVTNKIWSQIPNIPELGITKDPIIFYFDGVPRGTLHNVLIFGFPAKIALLQNPNLKDYNSITIDIWEELVSAVKDGKSLKRFGLPEKPLSINNVYSFNLVTKEKLLNTTEETRASLRKIIYGATLSVE